MKKIIRDKADTNVLNNGRKTVAVLVGAMSSPFNRMIMRGAADAGEEKGYNVIGYIGGPFKSPSSITQLRERVFELIDTDLIDGIIIPVGSHTRYLREDETWEFLKGYSSVPLINVG